MLGALSSGGVLKMVVLADQGTMSGQTKAQRAASLSQRSGLDGVWRGGERPFVGRVLVKLFLLFVIQDEQSI